MSSLKDFYNNPEVEEEEDSEDDEDFVPDGKIKLINFKEKRCQRFWIIENDSDDQDIIEEDDDDEEEKKDKVKVNEKSKGKKRELSEPK